MSHHDLSEQLGEAPVRPRRPRRSLAIVLCLALGLVFAQTGSALAVSGLAADGSAVFVQYPLSQTQGTQAQGTQAQGATNGSSPSDVGDTGESATEGATASGGDQAARQVAAADSGSELPFTGSASLLILALGGGLLLVTGALLRLRTTRGHEAI